MADIDDRKTVLIHSAAGGVGIASMQLAQYAGADVFSTVGSPDKREFIKSTFGLDDDHIFNSGNTSFGDQIMAATADRGVDIILNSLTGDMLDESFRILADGGMMVETDHLISRSLNCSRDAMSSPLTQFTSSPFTDVPNAVGFLRPGKHIGKVVISNRPNTKISVPVLRALKHLHFRDDATYLIVGGLRGLCGAVAIYLAKSGTKQLAVISRSGHTDKKSRSIVKQIKALGSNIDVLTADVTSKGEVQRAFNQTAYPRDGIIQGAMVLRMQGTWNLHEAAEKLNLELEFFTMLSSISGVIGQHEQANYAAANLFLDSFAAHRHQRGQAACSIDLGVIEDDGFIATQMRASRRSTLTAGHSRASTTGSFGRFSTFPSCSSRAIFRTRRRPLRKW
ncbi:hypothetical protein B0H66DRAFT_399989 [Apodospora peruviana]|uniref:Polyketide synthase n=1 Tax=Apodospora peruviana TaxID=516989 RepID=A0AAE0HTX2_9PEZI|nr:hypothetical protein B0H66DRAFT_399989 [Apodospora peruviana]